MKEILGKAKEEEEKYEWLKAADFYRQALTSVLESESLRKGEIVERLAYALYKAAFQVETSHDFKELMQQALASYGEAKELYQKSADAERIPRIYRCNAMIAFVRYWIAETAVERRRSIEECWAQTKKSLESFSTKEKEEFGKTFTQLSLSNFLLSFYLDADGYDICANSLKEAMMYGERTITLLSKSEDKSLLARAYVQTAIFQEIVGLNLPDSTDKERLEKVALNRVSRAREFSEEAAFLECYYVVGTDFSSNKMMEDNAKSLRHARNARDKFAIGSALASMSYASYTKRQTIENSEQRIELLDRALGYAEDARREFAKLAWISIPYDISFWVDAPHIKYYLLLASDETDMIKRHEMLQRSADLTQESLRLAELSGFLMASLYVHNTSSRVHLSLASIASDPDHKKMMLEKAIQHLNESIGIGEKTAPFVNFFAGFQRSHLANVKCQIANLTTNTDERKSLLREVIQVKQDALSLMKKDLSGVFSESKSFHVSYGESQFEYAEMLNDLFRLNGEKQLLENAVNEYCLAAETYRNVDFLSRCAECSWRSAQACEVLGEYLEAADSYELASKDYHIASEKMPKLREFYEDYALYMNAWTEIEKARYSHEKRDYDISEEHFKKAAELHRSSTRWDYLALNYAAWANVEHAEELSRKEQDDAALESFQQCLNSFEEAKKSIQKALDRIDSLDEKQMAINMIGATESRQEYCKARMIIEEAKLLSKKGEHQSSAKQYASAAQTLEKMVNKSESQPDKRELQFIASLSRAWQKMEEAEADESPAYYDEAADLFEKSKDLGPSEKIKALVLGHSRFCKALAAGTKFADTGEMLEHAKAMQHLESATSFYLKADSPRASEYAKATRLLFDAYVHMGSAARETDLDRKTKLYTIAQKVLQKSADAYVRAGYLSRNEQVMKLLESANEQRELAISLAEVLQIPIIASTTTFAAPSPTIETAVGLERFEGAEVNANLILSRKELKVGENVDVEIELANPGKRQALLTGIEGVIPEGFELTKKPEFCRVKDFNIDLKGRRLDPLKVEEMKLTLRPKHKGSFHLKPLITYIDENGNPRSHKPKPQSIEVTQLVLPDRIATGCQDLDDLLFGGIPRNSAIILASPSYDWREFLVNGFLETGAKQGEMTFYLTTSPGSAKPLVEKFPTSFHLFICNPQTSTIVKDAPNVIKLNGVENLTDITIALTTTIRKLDPSVKTPKRICIGLVSDVLIQHHAVQTRRWLNALIPELESNDFTTLAVVDPQMHPSEELHAILGLFDGEVNIYEKQTEKGSDKFLRIKRLSDGEHLGNELLLREEDLIKRKR